MKLSKKKFAMIQIGLAIIFFYFGFWKSPWFDGGINPLISGLCFGGFLAIGIYNFAKYISQKN